MTEREWEARGAVLAAATEPGRGAAAEKTDHFILRRPRRAAGGVRWTRWRHEAVQGGSVVFLVRTEARRTRGRSLNRSGCDPHENRASLSSMTHLARYRNPAPGKHPTRIADARLHRPETNRRSPVTRGAVPPPRLRPRPDGRVVQGAAGHGEVRQGLRTGTYARQALPRRAVGQFYVSPSGKQPPSHRASQAARYPCLSARDARNQPRRRELATMLAELDQASLDDVSRFQTGSSEVTEEQTSSSRGSTTASRANPQVQGHQPVPSGTARRWGRFVGDGAEDDRTSIRSRMAPGGSPSFHATCVRVARSGKTYPSCVKITLRPGRDR